MTRSVSSAAIGVVAMVLAAVGASTASVVVMAQSPPRRTVQVLDFLQYRDSVEPILLARRSGNVRCVVCHSRGGGNSFLEPLAHGRDAYDDEQSLRNFERVQRLVAPGAPMESILLTNPLAEDAGGSHWHAGGKHWNSPDDDEWQTLAAWVNNSRVSVDFQFYRSRVEPILLARRSGNVRCVVCHSRGGGNSFLEPLAHGRDAYDDEQSLRNFERVQRLVAPGAPMESILLTNPLAEDAGGSHWHAGGKHWNSPDDDEWQTLAAWVMGQTVAP